jgi:hypothetical protein
MFTFFFTFWFPGDPSIARQAVRNTPGLQINSEKSCSVGLQLESENRDLQADFLGEYRRLRANHKQPI